MAKIQFKINDIRYQLSIKETRDVLNLLIKEGYEDYMVCVNDLPFIADHILIDTKYKEVSFTQDW